MSNPRTIFTCSKCGAQSPKWIGRCLECGAWGTLTEEVVHKDQSTGVNQLPAKSADLVDLTKLNIAKQANRLLTNISEIDRVFGGGLVVGSLTLIGGEPGIGKSTLVAQIANALAAHKIIYASGEESVSQIKMRLERLHCRLDNLRFCADTVTEKICAAALEYQPKLLIVDSIQTVSTDQASGEAGSITQIRACTVKFLELAKAHDIAVILIGHITKDGQIAGPKSLEHIVDTVIYLETDTSQNYRLMRATKNRFGSTNEVGIFEMTGAGFLPISNPAGIFLESGRGQNPGTIISAIMEGTRPFLLEVQALASKTVFGYPQRKASGFDLNRLQVLAAVLTKRTKINLTTFDLILNIVGGLKIVDPGLDLAVCLAIASSLTNKIIPSDTIALGEVGLGGEIRPVSRLEDKLKEAAKLGFTTAIIPAQKNPPKITGLNLVAVKNLAETIEKI